MGVFWLGVEVCLRGRESSCKVLGLLKISGWVNVLVDLRA
jgi:hypothetical protein